MGGYYNDVIYSFTPIVDIWKEAQSYALQGAVGSSSTQACSAAPDWQTKADNIGAVIQGIQDMLSVAQTNLDDLNSIDPASLSTADLAQRVQDATDKYNSFQTIYQSLVSDVEQAKQLGNMTDNEKLATAERDNLKTSLTPPNCGPTEIPTQ
jgi:hypothetical protein